MNTGGPYTVEVRPSGEFSLDRAKARIKAVPLPPTLKHAPDGDRQLYQRTLANFENAESVRPCFLLRATEGNA